MMFSKKHNISILSLILILALMACGKKGDESGLANDSFDGKWISQCIEQEGGTRSTRARFEFTGFQVKGYAIEYTDTKCQAGATESLSGEGTLSEVPGNVNIVGPTGNKISVKIYHVKSSGNIGLQDYFSGMQRSGDRLLITISETTLEQLQQLSVSNALEVLEFTRVF